MNRLEVLREIEVKIVEQIASAERARQDAQDEANRHKGRMQSRYDTFKEEAQQLAAAHELRKRKLESELSSLRRLFNGGQSLKKSVQIGLGSIVTLETIDGQKQRTVILAPAGGGIELDVEGYSVAVVTPSSPLGMSLLGQVGGSIVEVEIGGVRTTYGILEVK